MSSSTPHRPWATAPRGEEPDELIRLRRRLHAIPEVGLELPQTQAEIIRSLSGLPVELRLGEGMSSVVAVIEGDRDGPTVLLRSDMDGLPVQERTGLPWAATNDAMHACGHDLHMAALVGAVELLAADRASLPGTVVAVFQPGEEGYGGAELMLRAGVLGAAGAPPVASFALHVFSYLPRGLFFTRPGVVMAGLRIMRLEVHGRGGHAARPSEARDPITTTAEIIQSMQSFVSRRVSPADPAVVTVGSLHAGSSPTVIPDVAVLELSIRTLSAETETMLLDKLPRLAAAIAAGHGLTVTATVLKTMPPTVNDEESVDDIRAAVSATVGEDRNRTLDFPEMVSEDFSYFLGRTGGAMVLLGAEDPAAGADGQTPSNHSPYARFDDRVVPEAALVLSSVARLRLARSSQ